MISLVVNADDLGLHPAIDEGILRAHKDGIVTSATLIVQGQNAAQAVRRARSQGLALGVHLCLCTAVAPAADPKAVASVAPAGRFRASWAQFVVDWFRGRIRPEEVDRELRAQVARARDLGADPDHLDAHQHLHLLPGVAALVHRLAREEDLPLRWPAERPRARWLGRPGPALKATLLSALALALKPRDVRTVPGIGFFDAGRLDEPRLLRVLEGLQDGAHELGTHPGLFPGQVAEDPSWRYGWEAELAALCSQGVKALILRREIQLISYRALRG